MMIRIGLIKSLVVILVMGMFSGCVWVEGTDDLQQFVTQVQTRPSKPIKSLPAFIAYEAFVYEGAAMRNPFVEIVKYIPEEDEEPLAVDLGNTQAPNNDRLKAYLEKFAIKDLSMVGTITKGSEGFWGLVVDTNGEIHRVSIGDFVGLDHGEVLSVDENQIRLVEIISNGRGGWITRPQRIELVESEDS
jgi:type IV pilus assembly protein PilP